MQVIVVKALARVSAEFVEASMAVDRWPPKASYRSQWYEHEWTVAARM